MSMIERLKTSHTVLGVTSPAYRKFVSSVFLTANPFRRSLVSSPSLSVCLNDLKEFGIVKFDENFAELAEDLNQKYFDSQFREDHNVKSADYCVNLHEPSHREHGLTFWVELSPLNPLLFPFFSNDRLIRLVNDYYGRQAYYRNMPVLSETAVPNQFKDYPTYKFHVDYGLKQISLMLLLSDVTENDTHMVYANGSHRTSIPQSMVEDRFSFDDALITEKYELTKVIGKKGTLFIFDAGNGFHKAIPKPNTSRRILHMNMTTGHYMLNKKKVGQPLADASRTLPKYVQRAYRRLIV